MTSGIGAAALVVQKAIYDVLKSVVPADDLTTLCAGRVFDGVPRTATMPYVVWRVSETDDASTSSTWDVDHVGVVDVWSREAMGDKEARRILASIDDRLRDFQGTFDGHVIVDCHKLGDLTFEEEDLTRHGVARYSVLSEPA